MRASMNWGIKLDELQGIDLSDQDPVLWEACPSIRASDMLNPVPKIIPERPPEPPSGGNIQI